MEAKEVANWMLTEVEKHGCVYQMDVVDYLVKEGSEMLLRENSDGNLVVGLRVLEEFKAITERTVVG
jgi:hypothetical protein